MSKWASLVVCLLILLVLCALVLRLRPAVVLGGAVPKKSPHVVVDTLNLTHHLAVKQPKHLTTEQIVGTIDTTAAKLRAEFPGRVMYVVKDRENALNDTTQRLAYHEAAVRNSVFIYVVERYEVPPNTSTKGKSKAHSARGRDDMYMAILARKHRCKVLTGDKFRDFDEWRKEVEPFHVDEYTYWRDLPERDYVKPLSPAYRALKRPFTITPDALGFTLHI